MEGKLIIFSAPSGAGKTTIVHHLLNKFPELEFSVSACSRKRREEEQEGIDYYFLSVDEFKKRIENKDFIEWEEVYADNFYGTLESELFRIWAKGKHVIFDVDVKGGLNLKKAFGDKALSVFVKAPSLQHLEERLKSRKTETSESIARRLGKAAIEMTYESEFDKVVLNDNIERAFIKAEELIAEFLKKTN